MISKYSDLNKFGGETWHIKIDSLFHIFIMDTTQQSFLVELKEWRFFNYKTRKSYISTKDFEKTVVKSFDNLQEYLNDNGKYYWADSQKNEKLNLIIDLVKNTTKSKALAYATIASKDVFDVLEPSSNKLENEVYLTAEYWTVAAFKALEKNDNESARVYAEKAYQLESNNIDISLIYWSTLIKKITNPSIQKLETNLKKAIAIYKEIKDKRNKGVFTFNENQKKKYSQLAEEQWEFHKYADDTIFRIKNNF